MVQPKSNEEGGNELDFTMNLGSVTPKMNEFDIMNRLQNEFENKFQQLRPLSLAKLAKLLDELEQQMTLVDEDREKPVFVPRLKEEWEDAIIKRYLFKEQGDIGTLMTPEEIKQAMASGAAGQAFAGEGYVGRFEQMRLQFMANQKMNKELEEFKTMEEYMETLFQKYQDNIVLLISNQRQARVPLSVNIKFKSYDDIKYMQLPDQKVRKRSKAQFLQAKDVMVDQLKQLEQALGENELDYLKIEGNLGGEDLLKRKLLDEAPSRIISRKIRDNSSIIRYLELSNIQTKNYLKVSIFRPSMRREVPNGNGPAISEVLEAISLSHTTLKNLEVLSFNNVQLDERIMSGICLILQSNFLKEIHINGCNLGFQTNFLLVQKLANSLSFNSSLRGIELNGNQLMDDTGCVLFQALLQQVNLAERENPMLLQKLCVKDNNLSERASAVLNQILMKTQMKHFDIRSNQIVLRFLDNMIVTAGYKFNLEFLGIEGNQRAYQSKNAVCSCLTIKTHSTFDAENNPQSSLAFTKVSPLQLQNRNQRIVEYVDVQKFLTAKVNIRKCRVQQQLVKFREKTIKTQNYSTHQPSMSLTGAVGGWCATATGGGGTSRATVVVDNNINEQSGRKQVRFDFTGASSQYYTAQPLQKPLAIKYEQQNGDESMVFDEQPQPQTAQYNFDNNYEQCEIDLSRDNIPQENAANY